MSVKREMFLCLLFLPILASTTPSFAYPIALPNCPDRCGNTSIPYPFGIQPGCHRDGFALTCNSTTNRAYLGSLEITDISIMAAEVRVQLFIASVCYSNETAWYASRNAYAYVLPPYLFSYEHNMFTTLGCHTVSYIQGDKNGSYASGCLSYCNSIGDISNGSCDGVGCCHTSIPKGLDNYTVYADSSNTNLAWKFSPCKYAFLVEKEWYNFSSTDLIGQNFLDQVAQNRQTVPSVLDWAIRNGSCTDATKPPEACASQSSTCYNSTNGVGYLCNCSQGYEGNPYLVNGCIDMNECNFPEKYYCQGRCINTVGDYNCECPKGQHGDGKRGTCNPIFPTFARWLVGTAACVIVVLALCFFTVTTLQSRKYKKEKEEYFKKNGGQQLQEMIAKQVETVQVFTEKQLELATNNFDKDRIIGSGGQGMVYRGTLDNERVVAIKRSKEIAVGKKEEFVNEIVIQSQINHRHVVRLLGCCLEVEVPMLVYEFISHGSLFHFLHDQKPATKISLDTRLRIARQSAEALAFMHSSLNHPILHGDVKSLNILLDDKLNAKVSDFGASSLVPLDKNQFVKFVQGTKGYLDPECFYTNQLTEKSDVFAFGVVILELITRKTAIFIDEFGESKRLFNSIHVVMKENRLDGFLDPEIVNETSALVLREVVELALRCIKSTGEERPMMIEVAEDLQVFARSMSKKNPDKNQEEATSYLSEISPHYGGSDSLVLPTTESTSVLHIDHIDIGR